MTDIQRLGGKRVGLDLDIGLADGVNERRFTNVRVPGEQDCSLVGVDAGQTA
jgi:hypothetical protein